MPEFLQVLIKFDPFLSLISGDSWAVTWQYCQLCHRRTGSCQVYSSSLLNLFIKAFSVIHWENLKLILNYHLSHKQSLLHEETINIYKVCELGNKKTIYHYILITIKVSQQPVWIILCASHRIIDRDFRI